MVKTPRRQALSGTRILQKEKRDAAKKIDEYLKNSTLIFYSMFLQAV
jgi:hypothetical protein